MVEPSISLLKQSASLPAVKRYYRRLPAGVSRLRRPVSRGGSILIICLWSICLLSAFSVILGYQVRQKLTLAVRIDDKDKLHFIIEAAIKRAVVELKKEPEKSYVALKDSWSNNPAVFKEINAGDGTFSIGYNYINEQAEVQENSGLLDEERKININKAETSVLRRLFHILGFDETASQDLAASIIDWRDKDSQLSIPVGSAEDSYYRSLRYAYEAKDAEFEVPDEIFLVKDMTRETFDRIKDYITIYGSGKVNINTASPAALRALGLDECVLEKVLLFRAGEDGLSATADDNIFNTASTILPQLSQAARLTDAEAANLSVVVDRYLTVNSDNFTAGVTAKLNNRKNTAKLHCVIHRGGSILYWQEF